jgi:hypothetical protein
VKIFFSVEIDVWPYQQWVLDRLRNVCPLIDCGDWFFVGPGNGELNELPSHSTICTIPTWKLLLFTHRSTCQSIASYGHHRRYSISDGETNGSKRPITNQRFVDRLLFFLKHYPFRCYNVCHILRSYLPNRNQRLRKNNHFRFYSTAGDGYSNRCCTHFDDTPPKYWDASQSNSNGRAF